MTRRKDVLEEKYYTTREAFTIMRISRATFWRRVKSDPALKPVYVTPWSRRWSESTLRKVMQGSKAAT